jgi:hypothetical protein
MIDTVIVGAGPYGLSTAAHLRQKGIPFRIFGRLMDSWLHHMPKGMLLKSDGFASNIYEPERDFTLGHFCAEKGISYADTGIPVRLETFAAYGVAFRDRKVPELEQKNVVSIDKTAEGFVVALDTGETVKANKVVLAVGITHFENVPANVAHLPAEFLSHSARHSEVEPFRGRDVIVLGAGASALDLAALLHEAGARVQLVARAKAVKFHSKAIGVTSFWKNLRRPPSGLGPGWKTFFFANFANIFHYLPQSLRLLAVRRVLGPAGGSTIKDKVMGKVPLLLGYTAQGARVQDGKVCLTLAAEDGTTREVTTGHIIAATGYKVEVDRLKFLSESTRAKIKNVNGAPILSSTFESSVPGLYFVGIAAASSFGPVMRFAYGAGFAARTVSRALAKSPAYASVGMQSSRTMAATK